MKLHYTRILVKISGEQLAGPGGKGFDVETATMVAQEVAQAVNVGAEIVMVVGGGNFVRGIDFKNSGVQPVTADYMGMLATMINALAISDIFASQSVPAHVLTTVFADQIADQFTQRRALHHLSKGRVVVVGGGLGRPYVTTDTGSVSLALELDCDVVCKLTKVDGVYDKDPHAHADANRHQNLTFAEALQSPTIKVMDKAALGLAMEHQKTIVVCDLHKPDNIKKLAMGEIVGTTIS
jgi:uridylate kinase